MIKIEVIIEDEQIEELFDNADVKFSKAKLKKLKQIIEDYKMDYIEQLEETLTDSLSETIEENWEE